MKKINYLIVLITALTYSQPSLNFEDLKKINSYDAYLRVVIENGFTKSSSKDLYWSHSYAYNLKKVEGNELASTWSSYYTHDNTFGFVFTDIDIKTNSNYENYVRILNQIKKECVYFKSIIFDGDDVLCYSCKNSKYKGKIGFWQKLRDDSLLGLIKTFTNEDVDKFSN